MAKRGRPKSNRVPMVKFNCRIGADLAGVIETIAGETGWTESKVAAMLLEAGHTEVFGPESKRGQARRVIDAQKKAFEVEGRAKAMVRAARSRVRKAAGVKSGSSVDPGRATLVL